jgi:hypothetical protein
MKSKTRGLIDAVSAVSRLFEDGQLLAKCSIFPVQRLGNRRARIRNRIPQIGFSM